MTDIEALRQNLTDMGLTPQVLIAIGAVALIGLFFSVRAILSWYLGIFALHSEVRALRAEIGELHALLSEALESSEPAAERSVSDSVSGADSSSISPSMSASLSSLAHEENDSDTDEDIFKLSPTKRRTDTFRITNH